jgi:hypothetical protein
MFPRDNIFKNLELATPIHTNANLHTYLHHQILFQINLWTHPNMETYNIMEI